MNLYERRAAASSRGSALRFDDSLKTILSADATTGFGAQSAWRQLVDLAGRRRIADTGPAIARLRMLRGTVPVAVRAASGRALAFAQPPAELVGFFAEDELAIAAPVLRTAALTDDDWTMLLPRLTPAGRSVLRHRRDLSAPVVRALESFGSTDFVLADERVAESPPAPIAPPLASARFSPVPDVPLSETPFVALGAVARGLPVVAQALRHAEPAAQPQPGPNGFVISDIVARIDAFNRARPDPVEAVAAPSPEGFRFETDAAGVIRWVEGIGRATLIGVSLAHAAPQGLARIDAVASGALRRRADFADARLEIGGAGDSAGSWRLSGIAAFDPRTGRFGGFRGIGRRPRRDQSAAPAASAPASGADSLRQLVHELRTPTNAIAGFAELIGSELLGPVAPTYRDRAQAIQVQATALIGAIEDLDTAARIESGALELRPVAVALAPLVARITADLAPLAAIRGVALSVAPIAPDLRILGDDRALERLLSRLAATLVAVGGHGETIGVAVYVEAANVLIRFDRPRALHVGGDAALLSVDAEPEAGGPLLGTGFALRLARNLAAELGGALAIAGDDLTLRLPIVVDRPMEQATTN